jgi:hypothetical protein
MGLLLVGELTSHSVVVGLGRCGFVSDRQVVGRELAEKLGMLLRVESSESGWRV